MTTLQLDDPFSADRLNGLGDFRTEWDIPTLGKSFTDAFSAAIDEVRAQPQLDPTRKIQAFIGQAGYGKTHLFGRLRYAQSDRVYISFIAAPSGLGGENKERQLENNLRWQLVESLLESTDCAPFRVMLARALVPSFVAYFDQLEPGLRSKCADIRNDLEGADAGLTVLGLFGPVEALGPYHQLADAVQTGLVHCPGPVVRALVLTLSPLADEARRWLRGEAGQMPESQLTALKLVDGTGQPLDSPPLIDILFAVSELLRLNRVPLAVCFDQLEELFKSDRAGFSVLTGQMMSWLQKVPNLVLGLGCMTDVWKELRGAEGFKAFVDRVRVYELPPLSGAEAAELVTRRMKSWTEFDPKRPAGWPFDLDSVRAFADQHEPAPRHFIQSECATRFTKWLSEKRQGTIQFTGKRVIDPLPELFRQEWAKTLQAIQSKRTSASNVQEADLWAGVREAIELAKEGAVQVSGLTIEKLEFQPLRPSAGDPKPSVRVHVTAGGKSASVVAAVSTRDGGVAFGNWYNALEEALKKPTVGAVVVWPRAKLAVGATAAAFRKYKAQCEATTLRPFALDEHETTFHQLECLRQLMRRAGADLILQDRAISKEECRKLILEAGVLANFKFYEFLFLNWKGLPVNPNPDAKTTAGHPAAEPTAATPPAAAPPTPAAAPTVVDSVLPPSEVPPKSAPTAAGPKGTAPASPPTPTAVPPVPPPPAAPPPEPTWAEVMAKRAADYLRKKGETVHPLGADVGPTFVRLKLELRGDADFGRVRKQAENLKVHLALNHEPLIASQAGYVSIDVQRPDRQTVNLTPLLAQCPPKFAGEPVIPAGVGVSGNVEWLNLSEPESCHLLVAGTTGSGKSEFLKVVLAALAARLEPSRVKFRLIDPKRVTFNVDAKSPYMGCPVVYDGEDAIPVLEECVEEMERRYALLQKRGKDHVRQLIGADAVPRWVVVFDEFADLMTDRGQKKLLEPLLKRLGAKARAAGIHLVLGTQRPEASVVTPLLRSNLPGRIGLQVASEKESKLFLDEPDAAYLFGKGDLVWKRGGGMVRLQSPFVPKAEFDKYLRTG